MSNSEHFVDCMLNLACDLNYVCKQAFPSCMNDPYALPVHCCSSMPIVSSGSAA